MSFTPQDTDPKASARRRIQDSKATNITSRIENAWEFAKAHIAIAQSRMITQANKHRQDVSFNIGDKVWLSSKNITTRRPSKKLDHKHLGPFKVIGKSRTAYELDLPTSMGIFNKFHASLLVKDPNDPLVGQEQPEPGPILVDGTDHYEVDEFLAI